nr:putative cleavage and polyadenylation specificity factor subunit 4-like protein [Manis javanica]
MPPQQRKHDPRGICTCVRFTFTFEKDVEMQKGTGFLPFQGMDRKLCPFRHDRGEKKVACKHWLRGLCKKGRECKVLHQYDVTRMPDCCCFSKFRDCNNRRCPFLHGMPAFKTRDSPWYDQGFCKAGPLCKYRHVCRIMCIINYLAGFCPEGPKCQFAR